MGDLSDIRSEENGDAKNWGRHGNLDLHGWAFDRFVKMLEYKGEERGIEVVTKSEQNTSVTCSVCGDCRRSNRVHRGLYVCQSCGFVGNADCNGAENIRQKVLPNPDPSGQDRDTGWLAQPEVRQFDRSEGVFPTRTDRRLQTIISHPWSGILALDSRRRIKICANKCSRSGSNISTQLPPI